MDEVSILWINDKNNEKRFNHMTNMLNKYFPKNPKIHIDAVFEKPKYHGVTIAQTVALQKGLLTNKPFIVLEDDVNFNENCSLLLIEELLKKKYDAIYLGISTWGDIRNIKMEKHYEINNNNIIFRHGANGILEDNVFKINSMYGAHAILYINQKYVLKTLKYSLGALMINKPHDVLLPIIQKKYKVYGLNIPVFYQDKTIGGQERETRVEVRL